MSLLIPSAAAGTPNRCVHLFQRTYEVNAEALEFMTARLHVRPIPEAQLEEFVGIATHPEILAVTGARITSDKVQSLFFKRQTTLSEALHHWESDALILNLNSLGIYLDGKLIGFFDMSEPGELHEAELRKLAIIPQGEKWLTQGLVFLPEYQKQGFGSEISALRRHIAFNIFQADGVFIHISDTNEFSQRHSKKFGFQATGIYTSYSRSPIYTLSNSSHQPNV